MKESISANHRLPTEILHKIFKQLQFKKELKSCLHVCKTWHFVAQGFFSDDIRVQINDMSLKRLYNDLPAFGHKVKCFTLTQLSTGTESPIMLRSALNLCPNLVELQFNFTDVYNYLKALNCHEAILPNIQKIQVLDLKACSPAVRRFHLWVNFRFRATITSLEIDDLEDNGALNNYGGLIKLASTFSNLIYLKAKCHSVVEREFSVDLTSLLTECPNLQELKLYGIGKITNHVKDIPASEPTEYQNLIKLKLKVAQIDIRSLEYIVTRFKNVENLRLITFNILPDISLTEQESDIMLTDLEAYTTDMKRVNINYKYKTNNYVSNRGKIRPTCGSNTIMMMGLPDGFILREEGWMGNDWLDVDEDEDEDYFYDEDEEEDEIYGSGNYMADMRLAHILYQHLLDRIESEEDEEGIDEYDEDNEEEEVYINQTQEEELFRAYYSS